MSLHDLASGVISTINPMMQCQWKRCIGFSIDASGLQTPTYAPTVTIKAQVQQLTIAELKHVNELNVTGLVRKIWCDAILSSVDRIAQLGGDIIILPDGTIWLVMELLEAWPDWSAAVIQKQIS